MNKKIRVRILLFILVMVSVTSYLDMNHNWDGKTKIVLHPINYKSDPLVQKNIDDLKASDFEVIKKFIEDNSMVYRGKKPDIEIVLGSQIFNKPELPSEETAQSMLAVISWSLKFRLFKYLNFKKEDFGSDSTMYLVYYNVDNETDELPRSTALQKGRMGVVNMYSQYHDVNVSVILHEILHTFGALDRYSMVTGFPEFPLGYAEPDRVPLHPQDKAEIMGAYIPINDHDFVMPSNISKVVMNRITAKELKWVD